MTAIARNARPGRSLYRWAIPAAALCTFAIFALLWLTGLQSIAAAAVHFLGVKPGPFPFVDTDAVLAAAECQRRGIDVYLSDPCDVFGRVHVYSPLWLALIPPGVGTAATGWVGAALDLLFILALPWVLRPRSGSELLVFAIAAFSPMIVFALERANNDLVIFLLVLGAGLLQAAPGRWRLWSYAMLVAAALLKYYPAVLLALAARERLRDAVLVAAGAAAALVLLAAGYHDVLGQALSNIPHLPYFTASFSARNLPFGLAQMLPLAAPRLFAALLFAALTALALLWLRRAVVLLETVAFDWRSAEAGFAAIGSLLIAGCFFAAQNDNYRGIYFLFVLPGLLRLRGAAAPAARRLVSRLVVAVVFLMWGEFFHRAPLALFSGLTGFDIAMLFWALREIVWWWAIAGLAAVALCYLTRLPLLRDGIAWLGRFCEGRRRSIFTVRRRD
jgi:Glycosyltransferase family 87